MFCSLFQETGVVVAEQRLPQGWEARTTREGMTYYIDHINKRSTWIHPRLGSDAAVSREQPVENRVVLQSEPDLRPVVATRQKRFFFGGSSKNRKY